MLAPRDIAESTVTAVGTLTLKAHTAEDLSLNVPVMGTLFEKGVAVAIRGPSNKPECHESEGATVYETLYTCNHDTWPLMTVTVSAVATVTSSDTVT